MKFKYLLLPALLAVFAVTCKHKLPEPTTPATTTTGLTTTTGGTTTGGTTTGGVIVTNPKDSVCFEQEIFPILNSNCANQVGCHNAIDKEDGVNLSSYASLKATISGKTLLKVINETDPDKRMPQAPNPALSASQIALITTWVGQGMKSNIDCQAPCDTVNVTYSGTVKKIVEDNCFGCHSTTSPVFSNYTQLKAIIDNGSFVCAINHNNGCSAMPKNAAKLSDCKLKQISKWLAAGAANN